MGSHYVVLTALQLTMYSRLTLNIQQSSCFCLPGAGVKHTITLSLELLM